MKAPVPNKENENKIIELYSNLGNKFVVNFINKSTILYNIN